MGGEIWKEMGREVGGAGMECTKYNSAETQQICHLGTPLEATAPSHTFLKRSFQGYGY